MLKTYDPKTYWTDKAQNYFESGEYQEKNMGADGFDESARIFVENVTKLPHGNVLEVGCGYGYRFRQLLKIDSLKSYTGIDISPTMIELFKKHKYGDKVKELLVGDAGDGLKFTDKSFDLVFCCGVLMHNRHENVIKILNEMKRVTKKYLLILEDRMELHHANNHNYDELFKLIKLKKIKTIKLPSLIGVTNDYLFIVEKI